MASTHIRRRVLPSGQVRYVVEYRLGGRSAKKRTGGRFKTKREAEARRNWIKGELAAMRVPDFSILETNVPAPTVRVWADRWQASRIDVTDATRNVDRKSLVHVLAAFGDRDPESLTAYEVAEWVVALSGKYKRGSINKFLGALQRVLDYADVHPNPARDRKVRLPREERREVEPPNAADMTAIIEWAAPKYRLPLIVLEATGMRVGELEKLTWSDVHEAGERWRVARQNSKTGAARWVNVPSDVFAAVSDLVPREDREPTAPVFPGLSQAKLRTDMARTCKAAGILLHSPHDLRHRRITLLHMQGVPLRQVGEWVGQRNLSVTADVYTHVLTDGEIDRTALLHLAATTTRNANPVGAPVVTHDRERV